MTSATERARLMATAQTALKLADANLREAREAMDALSRLESAFESEEESRPAGAKESDSTRSDDGLFGYTLEDFKGLTTAQAAYKIMDEHPELKNPEIARIIVRTGKSPTC